MSEPIANAESGQAQRATAAGAYQEFLLRFRDIEMPFCPFGMVLLHNISQQRPDLYELAQEYWFASLDHPAFQGGPDAQALIHHVGKCLHCQAC